MRRAGGVGGARVAVSVAMVGLMMPAALVAVGGTLAVGHAAAGRAWVPGASLGTTGQAGPGALARTSSDGRSVLHVVTTQAVGDSPSGVRYSRSTDRGASWEPPVLLGRRGAVVYRAAVAGSGRDVHVAFVAVLPGARTRLYVRSSGSAGRVGTWTPAVRLSSAGGLEYASIASAGRVVLVTVGDRRTGVLRLFRSRDGGVTWSDRVLARSTRLRGSWRLMLSRVSISGRTAVVSWDGFATGTSHVYARVSRDAGRTWSRPTRLGPGATSSNAALAGRVVVALRVSAGRSSVRTWRGGSWQRLRRVPLAPGGRSTGTPYVVLHGRRALGLATTSGSWPDEQVVWFGSSDDGRSWGTPRSVSGAVPSGSATAHAAVWGRTVVPVVLWDEGGWRAPGYVLLTSARF